MSSAPRIIFDASAINWLLDLGYVPNLSSYGFVPLISSINVVELACTADEGRRNALLDFAEDLRSRGDARILPPALGMMEAEIRAWTAGEAFVSYGKDDPIGAFLQKLLARREERTTAALDSIRQWKEAEEEHYRMVWGQLRDNAMWQTLLREHGDSFMEESDLGRFLARHLDGDDKLVALARASLPELHLLDDDRRLARLVSGSGPVLLYLELGAMLCFQHWFTKGSQPPHRRRDPIALDTAQYLYYGVADRLVSGDQKQRKRLSYLCGLRRPDKKAMSCEDLLALVP